MAPHLKFTYTKTVKKIYRIKNERKKKKHCVLHLASVLITHSSQSFLRLLFEVLLYLVGKYIKIHNLLHKNCIIHLVLQSRVILIRFLSFSSKFYSIYMRNIWTYILLKLLSPGFSLSLRFIRLKQFKMLSGVVQVSLKILTGVLLLKNIKTTVFVTGCFKSF